MPSFVLFLAAAHVAATDPSPTDCPRKPAVELLALGYDEFNISSGESAWRTLLNRGCVDSAIAALEAYRDSNGKRMTSEQKEELTFHMGQALAMSGREKEAVPYFAAATGPGSAPLWSAYVEATTGFLIKDRQRLERAIAAYEKLAKPDSMRLAVVRGLLRCFDRPYMQAAQCGM